MKTLDEVIAMIERHMHLYCAAQYDGPCLYYLKEYRDAKDTLEREKDRYQEAVKNCEEAVNKYIRATRDHDMRSMDTLWEVVKEENRNEPLTWDELKQMEGKPVWVEYGIDFQAKHWIILPEMACSYRHDRYSRDSFCLGVVCFYKDDIGKEWQAYRKERE